MGALREEAWVVLIGGWNPHGELLRNVLPFHQPPHHHPPTTHGPIAIPTGMPTTAQPTAAPTTSTPIVAPTVSPTKAAPTPSFSATLRHPRATLVPASRHTRTTLVNDASVWPMCVVSSHEARGQPYKLGSDVELFAVVAMVTPGHAGLLQNQTNVGATMSQGRRNNRGISEYILLHGDASPSGQTSRNDGWASYRVRAWPRAVEGARVARVARVATRGE